MQFTVNRENILNHRERLHIAFKNVETVALSASVVRFATVSYTFAIEVCGFAALAEQRPAS